MSALLIGFCVAYLAAFLTIPIVGRVAEGWRLLDYPDAGRHVHGRPLPRLGGVAVFVGLIGGFLVTNLLSDGAPNTALRMPPQTLALIVAGAMLFGIGLLDDLRDIPPIVKLIGQTAAAALVCTYGFRVDSIILPPGIVVNLGWLAIPVSVIWIVGVSNAFNLVDGIDGLAGSVAIVALLATSVSAVLVGSANVPWYAVVLTGALLAFLHFNKPPARIFLGDSGSLVVGFLLAVLSVRGAMRSDGVVYALVPIFALSYPLLDTGIAILRRWLRGAPLSRADDRHIHHQLRTLGLSPRVALGIIVVGSIGVAVIGLFTAFASPAVAIVMTFVGIVVLAVILVRGLSWLQYHEFLEMGSSFLTLVPQTRRAIQDGIYARDLSRLIACARTFEEVEALLSDAAADLGFAHIQVGTAHASPPLDIQRGAVAGGLWRLERPLPSTSMTGEHLRLTHGPFTLTIWCSMDAAPPIGAPERLARILAPTLSEWLDEPMHRRHTMLVARAAAIPRAPIDSPPIAQDAIRRPRDVRQAASAVASRR